MEVKVEIGVEVEVVIKVEVHKGEDWGGKREKEKNRRQKKPSVPKPGNPEKKMEYKSRVIQLRGSRPQGLLVFELIMCSDWGSYCFPTQCKHTTSSHIIEP